MKRLEGIITIKHNGEKLNIKETYEELSEKSKKHEATTSLKDTNSMKK